MKFYYKIIVSIVVLSMDSTGYSSEFVKKAIWGAEPETCAELIQKEQKPMEVIRSEDIKDKKLAALLDQAIPTGNVELYNPSNVINQTIKLKVGGKEKSYIVDQFHLWHSHWICANNWRLFLGICGAYTVCTYFLPTLAFVALVGGGALYIYKNTSTGRVAQTLGVHEATLTSSLSTASSQVGLTNALGEILSQQEDKFLNPTYRINDKDQVECIYQGTLTQGFGKLLGYHIVLRPAL